MEDFVERLAKFDKLIFTFNFYRVLDDWSIACDKKIVFISLGTTKDGRSVIAISDFDRSCHNLIVTTDENKKSPLQ